MFQLAPSLACLLYSHCPLAEPVNILNCYQFTLSSHRGHSTEAAQRQEDGVTVVAPDGKDSGELEAL